MKLKSLSIMKKEGTLRQRLFGSFAIGGGKVPIRSNVYKSGGYSQIGGTNKSTVFDMDRKSPLLGNSSPSNLISGYLDRVSELRGYQLLDISKLATHFFSDYITNFLKESGMGQNVVTIMNEEGNVNETVTERINKALTKEIKIHEYIRDHMNDYVFYGQHYSLLQTSRDETGHTVFRVEELHDPLTVITKKKRNSKGIMEESFLARGDDGSLYEIPKNEVIYIASNNLRLVNDMSEEYKAKHSKGVIPGMQSSSPGINDIKKGSSNRDKVLKKESYVASEPLMYSLVLKVKELVVKELLVSLISLRDLSSVQIFLLQFDKAVPLETANDICARTTKLANKTNELASFLTSQFDAVSFIENALTSPAKFIPDFNSTLGAKNAMLPLDKLSDKIIEIMQTVDQCKAAILGPLGLPATLIDSTSGSKWQVLQQSERANSRVSAFMGGIKDSVTNLVLTIYKTLYSEDLDPSLIKLHISDKTSVEYNNQINQSESIGGLMNGITGILQNSLQVLDMASPLVDPKAFISYIQTLIKDIDPNTEPMITEETIEKYIALVKAKVNSQFEQLGVPNPDAQEQQ